jgi:hypothetical protein
MAFPLKQLAFDIDAFPRAIKPAQGIIHSTGKG